MGRSQPIHRLIDGSPDATGEEIAARALKLAPPATIVANAVGALVVVVLAVFVLPTPHLQDRSQVRLVNLVVAALYVLVAIAVGTAWAYRACARRSSGCARNAPTDGERRDSCSSHCGS